MIGGGNANSLVNGSYSFTLTSDGNIDMPDYINLASGGQGVRNSAALQLAVNRDGNNVIQESSIALSAGNGGISSLVFGPWTGGADGSGGPTLVYAGTENVSGGNGPGFAGFIAQDPEINSQYSLGVDSNGRIIIGATQGGGSYTNPTYSAGIGVLNSDLLINGLLAQTGATWISGKYGISLTTDRGSVQFGYNLEAPGLPQHYHINKSIDNFDLFFGDDQNYVKLPIGGNVVIGTPGTNNWQFNIDGTTQFPNYKFPHEAGSNNTVLFIDTNGNLSWNSVVNISNTAPIVTQGSIWWNTIDGRAFVGYNGSWIDMNPTVLPAPSMYLGNITIDNTSITSTNIGSSIEILDWTFDSAGNLTLPNAGSIVFGDGSSQATAPVEPIEDMMMLAIAKASSNAFTNGSKVDVIVSNPNFVAMVLYAYTSHNSASPVVGTSFVVPAGKTAIISKVNASNNVLSNPVYQHRLNNLTQSLSYAPSDTGVAGVMNNGFVMPDSADDTISIPYVIGRAGDILQCSAWTNGDGHSRTIDANYIRALI